MTARYAASKAYFAYLWQIDEAKGTIGLTCSGSGGQADFRVLLPEGCEAVEVTVQGKPVPFELAAVDQSRYAVFSASVEGLGEAAIAFRQSAGR